MPPWRETIRAVEARALLHGCDAVGRDARVDGRPFVENRGEIVFGDHVVVGSVPVRSHFVAGPHARLVVGHGVHIAHGAAICAHASVTIGDGCRIGPFVTIVDIDFHEVRNRDAAGQARPISIGRNVTIGAGAVVLRGAVIEDDVVIAPNSVVARRIPRGARVAGVPARPVLARIHSNEEKAS